MSKKKTSNKPQTKPVEASMSKKKTSNKPQTKPVEASNNSGNVELVELVDMVNGEKKAEVHPLEVGNYELGGWSKAK